MSENCFAGLLEKKFLSERTKRRRGPSAPAMEPLDRRVMMAVMASFSAANGVLTVMGDALDNSLSVSRDAAGTLVVNSESPCETPTSRRDGSSVTRQRRSYAPGK